MLRRFTRGKDSNTAKQASNAQPKKEQKPQDAEGFLCPMCMARLPGPAELQNHFEKVHSNGGSMGIASEPAVEKPALETEEKLIDFDDEDNGALGQRSQLQLVTSEPKDSQEEVIFLQQELSELGTAIKEEKWYSGQLKDELDKVAKERDKLEEERDMFQEEYNSKLRSAEDSFVQVAEENEKLKEELRYADVKALKERHNKLNSEIESLKMDLSQEKEMKSAVEEANKHMMEQMEKKDTFIDQLNFQLNQRPTSDNLGTLENEVAALKNEVVKLEKEKEMSAQVESGKWMQNVEEMKDEISKQKLMVKELEMEKTVKVEQIEALQNSLNVALETSKQAQEQSQDKQQQLIDFQHEAREAQAAVKENAALTDHLEKQLQEAKTSLENEVKERQNLQQKIRSLENEIDASKRGSSEKDNKLKEFETLLAQEKGEIQRMEAERSELVAKIESGSGVETAINQLRQEKEKLIDGVAKIEREMAEQSKKFVDELNDLRNENTQLKDEVEGVKIENQSFEKGMKTAEDDLNLKQTSIDQLKMNLREKFEELRQEESKRSAEKSSFEQEIGELSNTINTKIAEYTVLEQKLSKASTELSEVASSKVEIEESLKKERDKSSSLEQKLSDAKDELSKKADAFTSTQEVLAKEKDDRKVEVERLEGERTNLLKEKLDNEASIKELNEKLASKDASIAELETHVGEFSTKHDVMSKELVVLRENEAMLKAKVHDLDTEFKHQKEALNLQMEMLRRSGEERESQFKSDFESKGKEIEKLRSSFEEETMQLKEKYAEKESAHKEKLKEKEGELFFVSESTKEAIAGYQKSVEMLEAELKKRDDNSTELENKISTLQNEKAEILTSLELKDSTLHDIQRKLEVAEAELKKKCESCRNYEIQLCRFQETQKEQTSRISNLEEQNVLLSKDLKTSTAECKANLEQVELARTNAKDNEERLRKDVEQAKEVNSILDARVLELDDELKEAYNKFDNMKSQVSTMSEKISSQEDRANKLMEEKSCFEKEISNLKKLEEEMKSQIEEEKNSANIRVNEVLQQKEDVQSQLEKAEDTFLKEKEKGAQIKEAMNKMQNVMKEKMGFIEKKVEGISQEKDDMKRANEESEARLNMEIKSLRENLSSSRKEIEDGKAKTKELNYSIAGIEKEKDTLRGDVAVLEVQIQNVNDEKRALTDRVLQSEDAHKRTKERLSDTNRRLEQALAALQELGQENQSIQMQQNFKLSRQWEDDNVVTNCKACDKLFSLTVRKHHCRHCGAIFCNDCSNSYTEVAASKRPVRVCERCYAELNTIRGRRVSAASTT